MGGGAIDGPVGCSGTDADGVSAPWRQSCARYFIEACVFPGVGDTDGGSA